MEPAVLNAALHKSAARVITHMNADHADRCLPARAAAVVPPRPLLALTPSLASLLAYAHHFAALPAATAARMEDLRADGFVLTVTVDGAERAGVLVKYSTPLESAAQVRKVAVTMHMEAFAALGFAYRLRSGYYQNSAAMVVSHTGGVKVWLPLTGAIAAGAYYYFKPSKP